MDLSELETIKFESNMKSVKRDSSKWANEKKLKKEKELEEKLEGILFQDHISFSLDEQKDQILEMERRKRTLLDIKEASWRMKRISL
jgi:hypothetical protein